MPKMRFEAVAAISVCRQFKGATNLGLMTRFSRQNDAERQLCRGDEFPGAVGVPESYRINEF